MSRMLIVNADDFGMSPGVNDGIVAAHDRGIVTSTSLMVGRDAAGQAAGLSRLCPGLGVGLHIDLGEWHQKNGSWIKARHVADLDDPEEIMQEIDRQIRRFQDLMERDPTHLDSHQHVHLQEPVRSAVLERALRMSIPARGLWGGVRACGSFYGQGRDAVSRPEAISAQALVHIIQNLPPGVTELCCHPGKPDAPVEAYIEERRIELDSLCDPQVATVAARSDVELRSFEGLLLGRDEMAVSS